MLVGGCSGISEEVYNSAVSEKDALQAEYDDLQAEYEQYKEDTADYLAMTDTEKAAQQELVQHQDEIDALTDEKETLENEISALQNEITGLEEEIEELEGDAITAAGQPKKYPAGYLYAGTDFPTGRYRIYDGSSNFVVYDAAGRLRVNIILGGRYGVDEYIYTFSIGDEIQADSSFKLEPIN